MNADVPIVFFSPKLFKRQSVKRLENLDIFPVQDAF